MKNPALALALAAAMPAQTFVVDAAGGVGAAFTDIATAATTVPDGATLLVRAGTYAPFRVTAKSLTVLCDPGVVATSLGGEIEVDGLAPGQQVTIRGIEVVNIGAGRAFHLHDNNGSVLLDTCAVVTSAGVGGPFRVLNCRDVQIHQCLATRGTQEFLGSSVRVSSSVLAGPFFSVSIVDSTADFVDTTLRGDFAILSSGISMSNSIVRVLAGCKMEYGLFGQGTAIFGNGTVRLDPTVQYPAGSTLFGPDIIGSLREMPAVAATTTGAGGIALAGMVGPAGGVGALFVGLPALPSTPLPGLDPLVTLAGTENVVAVGVFGPPLISSYAVPPLPLLLGVRVAWQGASIDATNGLQIGNGVVYVHH